MNFYQLNFGIFSLKIYGFLVACAFILASYHFFLTLHKRSVLVDFFLHHFWKWLLVGVLVGRLVVLALHPEILTQHDWYFFFAFWEGEINFYGAMLGLLLYARWDLKHHGYAFSQWLDMAVKPFLIGMVIVDIAAFVSGAVYGTETSLPWGVQYETFGVDILNPVHPIPLYSFLIHFWLLVWSSRRAKGYEKTPEKLAIRVGLLFFIADFLLQFLYGDKVELVFDLVRWNQVFDVVAILILVWRGKRKKVL